MPRSLYMLTLTSSLLLRSAFALVDGDVYDADLQRIKSVASGTRLRPRASPSPQSASGEVITSASSPSLQAYNACPNRDLLVGAAFLYKAGVDTPSTLLCNYKSGQDSYACNYDSASGKLQSLDASGNPAPPACGAADAKYDQFALCYSSCDNGSIPSYLGINSPTGSSTLVCDTSSSDGVTKCTFDAVTSDYISSSLSTTGAINACQSQILLVGNCPRVQSFTNDWNNGGVYTPTSSASFANVNYASCAYRGEDVAEYQLSIINGGSPRLTCTLSPSGRGALADLGDPVDCIYDAVTGAKIDTPTLLCPTLRKLDRQCLPQCKGTCQISDSSYSLISAQQFSTSGGATSATCTISNGSGTFECSFNNQGVLAASAPFACTDSQARVDIGLCAGPAVSGFRFC